jgi:arabinogalactan endo-1,4-beta-galactosidase
MIQASTTTSHDLWCDPAAMTHEKLWPTQEEQQDKRTTVNFTSKLMAEFGQCLMTTHESK